MKKLNSSRKLCLETLEDRTLLAVTAGGEQAFGGPLSPEETLGLTDTNFCEDPSPAITSSSVTDIDITNLNSKPDSQYYIYLDFDGHVTSGTSWNTDGNPIVTPRFTIDGDTTKTSFTDAEQVAIYQIWLGVAEDFIPFDVNVTTVEPSQADFLAGRAQRVVIGGSNTDWFGSSAAGVSYYGSFAWHNDCPNFVFSEGFVDSDRTHVNTASVAAAASHEMGHALGVSHQGYYENGSKHEYFGGANGWGPIMGSSGRWNLTQWSQGDYQSATNTEDELEIITTQNGFGYRSDDYADSFSGAAVLNIAGGEGEISGIIERNTDIDYFVFESDGSELLFRIGGIKSVTNLDVLVTVYGSDHQVLFVCDPSDRLDAEFVFSEEAGTYYLSVEGTGLETDWPGIYTDYGSLGAYTVSVGYPNTLIVTTLDDTVSNDGFLSLREAVLLASEKCSTILFDSSLANGTIFLTAGQIELNSPVVIDASGIDGGITIDAQSSSRVFMVNGTAVLRGLTITGGRSTEADGGRYSNIAYGGGIFNSGSLTLVNCLISNNVSVYTADGWGCGYGGGIYNDEGCRLTLTDCTVSENTSESGGGIYNSGALTLTGCTVTGNASHNGGGIYNHSSSVSLVLTNCIISENTVEGGVGGGICSDGTLTLTDCTFLRNKATSNVGGAILNGSGATLTLTSCELLENVADAGGGIYNNSTGTLTLTNCTISGNTSVRTGGGIHDAGGTVMLADCTVTENTASSYGGGIYNSSSAFTLTNCTISENTASSYGGGIYNSSGTLTLADCTILGNTASSYGGGIYNSSGTLTLTDCTVSGNAASSCGGGIDNTSGTLTLTNCIVSGNTANGDFGGGGGIYNSNGTFTLTSCTVTGNTSISSGGGIYNSSWSSTSSYFYNTIVAQNTAGKSGNDIHNNSYDSYLHACNTLSSFMYWNSSPDCLTYDSSLPLFTDAPNGDYTLAENSQAIDKGNNDYVTTETDLAGNARIANNTVDLGALEYGSSPHVVQLAAPEITVGKKGIHVSYGADRHQIAWTVVENASGYELQYSADGSRWTTVSVSDTSAVVTGLTYGADMRYRVRALGTGSYTDSDWSEIKTFNVCPMDIDGDSDISNGDRALLASSWLFSEGDDEFVYACDINGDGDISNGDRSFLSINWLGSAGDDDLQYPRTLRADAVFAEYASADLGGDWGIF